MPFPDPLVTDYSTSAPSRSVGPDVDTHGSYLNSLVSRTSGTYNVKAYGAVGNGATNDTAAIQAAIDAASTAGGGTVTVPPGNYIINQITVPSEVWLIGAGRDSALTCNSANPNAAMILLPAESNFNGISSLYLNGNKGAQTIAVAAVATVAGALGQNHQRRIDRCFIYNFSGRGIELNAGGEDTRIYDNYIYGCDLEGVYSGVAGTILHGNVSAQSGLEGYHFVGWNARSTNNKAFYSGRLNAARGAGYRVVGSNHMSANDESQDNFGPGWLLDTCANAVVMGGNVGDNAGAAIKIVGGSYHRVAFHAGGGVRTKHTTLLEVASSPANCFLDLSYNPASLVTNAPVLTGTLPASNRVDVNKRRIETWKHAAGSWLVPPFNSSTATPANGALSVSPMEFTRGQVLDRLSMEVTTAGEAASEAKVVIYRDDGTETYPGALLASSVALSTATTGFKDDTTTSVTIPETGLYWLGVHFFNATTTRPAARTNNGGGFKGLKTTAQSSTSFSLTGYIITSSLTGVVPATYPAGAAGTGNSYRAVVRTA